MVRVAPYMSENISRNIIRLVLKTDGGSGYCGGGAYGMSVVPFNRCFIDSFNIVVT